MSVLKTKTYSFAISIVKLHQQIVRDKKEYILSKQIVRSGTAIGALVAESVYAQTKPDFITKLNIALKEANETEYWLHLLKDTEYIEPSKHIELIEPLKEILRLLISSIKTARGK